MTRKSLLIGVCIGWAAIPVAPAEPAPLFLAAAATAQPTDTAVAENKSAAPGPAEKMENRALSDIEKLFTYFEEVQKLTPDERLQEYELLKRTWNQDSSEYVRLRLAILLSVPDSTFHDDARAQSLIDPILKEKSGHPRLRPMAYLLSILLAGQRDAGEELRVLKEALQDEAERNRALEQKLEALKTLEKNLIERESGNRRKAP